MSEAKPTTDRIDQANTLFWNPPALEELMVDIPPLGAEEDFAIRDVTDEEWEVFADALVE